MIARSIAATTAILFFVFGAFAATTNGLSNAEIEGRNLVQQILGMRPTENVTKTAILKIRNRDGKRTQVTVKCEVIVTETNWMNIYELNEATNATRRFIIKHDGLKPNRYEMFYRSPTTSLDTMFGTDGTITNETMMMPFGGSDFCLADMGLEFFHWPQQKVLRKEFRRSCGCSVLESVNPNPTTNGYSRVVTWIDNESFGIVQAEAYDSKNKLLKEFYPKDIKKVNGQWQVQTLDISNRQTGSSTRLEFDLDGK